jgi:hypothetical protein
MSKEQRLGEYVIERWRNRSEVVRRLDVPER